MSEELEQRLRQGRLVREAEGLRGECRELPHPDAIEAADTLKRYREALEAIAIHARSPVTMQKTARNALSGTGEG